MHEIQRPNTIVSPGARKNRPKKKGSAEVVILI